LQSGFQAAASVMTRIGRPIGLRGHSCPRIFVLLPDDFLFFGGKFFQNGVYVSLLAGLKIIIRPTQGFATLTLGFYVAGPLGRQAYIR